MVNNNKKSPSTISEMMASNQEYNSHNSSGNFRTPRSRPPGMSVVWANHNGKKLTNTRTFEIPNNHKLKNKPSGIKNKKKSKKNVRNIFNNNSSSNNNNNDQKEAMDRCVIS